MLGGGEGALAHLVDVAGEAVAHGLAHVREALDELRAEVAEHAQHVLVDEDLAVAAGAGADADGGDAHFLGDQGGKLGGHGLEHDGERAGGLERLRVGDQLARSGLALALHLEAAERVDGLRRQAQVPHDGDAGGHHGGNLRAHLFAAFQLHAVRAAFLEQAAGVAYGIGDADLVGQERHVADDQGVLRAAGDGGAVVDHVFDGHGQGVLVTEHHVAQRVADEDAVDAGLILELGGGVIVGREHGELAALGLCLGERCHGVLHGFLSFALPAGLC